MQTDTECTNAPESADSGIILFGDKKVKYLKPRIGTYFQAKVDKYVAPTNQMADEDEEATAMKPPSLPCSQKLVEVSDSVSSKRRRRGSYNATRSDQASQSSLASQEFNADSSGLEESHPKRCGNHLTTTANAKMPPRTHHAQWTVDGLKYTPLPGGLCVHRPNFNPDPNHHHQHHDVFLAFCRNIFLQTPQSSAVSEQTRDRLWKKEERWIRSAVSVEDGTNNISGKKRGRKRKVVALEDTSSFNNNKSHMVDDTLSTKGLETAADADDLMDANSISSKAQSRTPTPLPELGGDIDEEGESQDIKMDDNLTRMRQLPQDQPMVPDEAMKRPMETLMPESFIIGLENDEVMLEYLQLKHNGDVDRGKYATITSLSMGKSGESRKLIRKILKDEEKSRPPDTIPPLSESWRRRYERITSPLNGDHRPISSPSIYPYFNDDTLPTFSESDYLHELYPWYPPELNKAGYKDFGREHRLERGDDTNNIEGDPFNVSDDIQTTWNSVLLASKHILELVQKKNSSAKPTFRQALNIVEKAYSLPKPEDAFGRRDTLSKAACTYMNSLMDCLDMCRNCLSELLDASFSLHSDGVDLNHLRKVLNSLSDKAPLIIEDFDILQSMLDEASSWESKLIHITEETDTNTGSEELHIPQLTLSFVEDLAHEGKALSLRPSSLVLLEDKIEKAHLLRSKICRWKKSVDDEHENIKYISTMIREANKINLSFPELSILSKVHKDAEDWMEKAQVAIRTRISLHELDALVRSGGNMPIDFADVLAKLESRYEQACEWIALLRDIIPCPSEHVSRSAIELDCRVRDEWFERMLKALMELEDEDRIANLLELSSQGLRLTVELDLLGLLQVAIDAKNWSMKAKRWVPTLSGDQWKRGKLEDIEEHLEQADVIREKRKTMTGRKSEWTLYHEKELEVILSAAEEWLNTYRHYIDGDNRRAQGRPCAAYHTLSRIVNELESIPCNLGNAGLKMNKIFSQAQNWIKSHSHILQQCGVELDPSMIPEISSTSCATIDELNSVIDIASKDIAVDLEEVKELQKIYIRGRKWLDKVQDVAPKRNKRNARSKGSNYSKYTKDEVLLLIEEAKSIPLDTSKEVERLTLQLSDIKAWCLSAQGEIRAIIQALEELCKERSEYYGSLDNFAKLLTQSALENDPPLDHEGSTIGILASPDGGLNKARRTDQMGNDESDVHEMIASLVRGSETLCILTAEETIVDLLAAVSVWCNNAFVLLSSPHEIYSEKKSFQDLDTLISEAEGLVTKRWPQVNKFDDIEDENLLSDLLQSCTSIVACDVDRMRFLRSRRDEFYSWCEKALLLLSTDNEKPFSLDALLKLEADGAAFPQSTETVRNVRNRASAAVRWTSSVHQRIKSGIPIPIDDAKDLLVEGEKLNINCQELRTLRTAIKTTRGWIGRVKKLDLDLGSSDLNLISDLLREHETFLVSSTDQTSKLKQAVCSYCICRRPYDGFMIGCDECDEWYHGLCIGISESQAEKCDKYTCLRCSIKKHYYQFCLSIANIIKKWCDQKELAKARQIEGNKLQRRIRERKREILKVREGMESNARLLESLSPEGRSHDVTNINSGGVVDVAVDSTDPPTVSALHTTSVDGQDSMLVDPPSDLPLVHHVSVSTDNGLLNGERDNTNTVTQNALQSDDKQLQITELKKKLQVSSKALEQSHQKLNDILNLVKDRKALENKEDSTLYSLRYWFVLIRCKIIAPKSIDIADASRPILSSDNVTSLELLSEPMKEAVQEATALELLDFVDVNTVISNFSSIGWCLLALNILRRKPKIEELQLLSTSCSAIKFPDTKCIGLIRSMITRVTSWQNQVRRILDCASTSTNSTPEVTVWHEQLSTASSIPVITEESTWLENIVADGCRKHCICEGPVRMSLMLSCDACGKWFHGACIQVSEAEAETLPIWLCSSCSGSSNPVEPKIHSRIRRWKPSHSEDDVSNSAPNPALIWPPFGLADSSEAVTSFGGLVCSMDLANMKRPQPPSQQLKEDSDVALDTLKDDSDVAHNTADNHVHHIENDIADNQVHRVENDAPLPQSFEGAGDT